MKEYTRNQKIAGIQLNSCSNSAVTQPKVMNQAKNAKRADQIKSLHNEFEDLKKKIRDVESKNERIIENIHKQYDFKKKNIHSSDNMIQTSPIIYYERQQKSQVSGVDNVSNKSDQSQFEYKMNKQLSKKSASNKKNIVPPFHQSMEYQRTQQNDDQDRDPSENGSNKGPNNSFKPQVSNIMPNNQYLHSGVSPFLDQSYQNNPYAGLNPYQISMQFPPYTTPMPNMNLAVSQVGSVYTQNNIFQLEQNLKRERQKIKALEKQIDDKQIEMINMRKIQKKYNILTGNVEDLIENSLQEFMEDVVKKKMYEIEKCIKKNENKMKRLILKMKDKQQQYRSNKNIDQQRRRRSNSRSKRDSSPKLNTSHSHFTSASSAKIPNKRVQNSSQEIKGQEQPSNKTNQTNKHFEQIANKYEEIIRVKNEEIEIAEKKIKQKDKQLSELSNKYLKLEKRVSQLQQIKTNIKSRKNSDKSENLLANLQFESDREEKLQKRVIELESELKMKVGQIKEKEMSIEKMTKKWIDSDNKIKRLDSEIYKAKEQSKNAMRRQKNEEQFENRLKRLEADIQAKDKELGMVKDKYNRMQAIKIEKECQNYTLQNKLKKMESALRVKEGKITQLQKIIQNNNNDNFGQILQKSLYLDKNQQEEISVLKSENERLEEELTKQKEQIFVLLKSRQTQEQAIKQLQTKNKDLSKQNEAINIQNQSMKINLKALEFQKYSKDRNNLNKLLSEQIQSKSQDENEDEKQMLREEINEITKKYEENQRVLKILKHDSLEYNTKVIKLNSELNYYKQMLSERELKYQKLKREFQQNKFQLIDVQQVLSQKESQLEVQRKVNQQKIRQIESQWIQFEQEMKLKQEEVEDSNNMSELRNSRNFSDESFVNYKNSYNSINAQNEYLSQKLKEAEKILEIQRQMEQKIIEQYKVNIDRIKSQLKEKAKQAQQLLEENETLKRKLRVSEQNQIKSRIPNRPEEDQLLIIDTDKSQKIIDLENELFEVKDLNNKLAEVEQELFNQISQKQDEKNELLKVINHKNIKIQELQDIIELKEMNFSSHISSSNHKSKIRDSMKSQSSLRYSMMSNNLQKDKTMQIQLSEAGESFFQHNQSMISNISQVFEKEQFPYQKMQLKRIEQRRLFEKTAAYIKSLKKAIEEKSKKIKTLEKKIDSLRNSELIRKNIYEVKQCQDDGFGGDHFKDYYSVQLEESRSNQNRYKQLEHQTKLTIQQNNMLTNQIEHLQDELLKAQEQQNSLVKIKELYKQQIKKLIKKNEEQAKIFEEEIKKQRARLEASESIHNMEALKQLFIKIMNVIVLTQSEGHKSKRKQQRKKELTDYVKIYCNIIQLDPNIRQKILLDLTK